MAKSKKKIPPSRRKKRTRRSQTMKKLKKKYFDSLVNEKVSCTPGSVSQVVEPEPGPSGLHNSPQKSDDEQLPTSQRAPSISSPELERHSLLESSGNDSDYYPELIKESVPRNPEEVLGNILIGNRIVDIAHYTETLLKLGEHPRSCTTGGYKFTKETRNGLRSEFEFNCDNCNRTFIVATTRPGKTPAPLNEALVWGATSVGIGFSQAQEMMTVLDIPMMNEKTYKKAEATVAKTWHEHLTDKISKNGAEELAIAVAKNQFQDGVAFTTAIVDGAWCMRTFGHDYNAKSGVACVIGIETKKLLFLGIRNKYCYVCAKTSKGEAPPKHTCFMNYRGTSTAMEQDVIVEAFNCSEKQHNLRYKYIVGDGDSSVFAKIKEKCTYGRRVEKVECAPLLKF